MADKKLYCLVKHPKVLDNVVHLLEEIAKSSKKDIFLYYGNGEGVPVDKDAKGCHLIIFGVPSHRKNIKVDTFNNCSFYFPSTSTPIFTAKKLKTISIDNIPGGIPIEESNNIIYIPVDIIDNPEQEYLFRKLIYDYLSKKMKFKITSEKLIKELALVKMNKRKEEILIRRDLNIEDCKRRINESIKHLSSLYDKLEEQISISPRFFNSEDIDEIVLTTNKIKGVENSYFTYINGEIFFEIKTTPQILVWNNTDIPIGKYTLRINLSSSGNDELNNDYISDKNIVANIHPHANSSTSICWGEYGQKIGEAKATFNFPTIASIFFMWLNSYNPSSRYHTLESCLSNIGIILDEVEIIEKANELEEI